MPRILTNAEIVDELKAVLGTADGNNGELVKTLGISRQAIYQYTKSESVTINNHIISVLIERLNRKNEL